MIMMCGNRMRVRLLLTLLAGVAVTFSSRSGPLQLISVRDLSQPAPAGGGGDSWTPIISPDGRYVLFASTANNLTLTSQSNALPVSVALRLNVYLRDRANGSTTLVSANATGTGGGNGDSVPTAISTNGRYACFESAASNLVAGDTNGLMDVFVRDLASNTTVLVSIAMDGGPGNGVCRSSTMTPDGHYVAFVSAATNLVSNDTNGIPDVFIRDLQAGTTTLVSVGAQSTNSLPATSSSEAPDISADGRYVAFYSSATNLVLSATNGGEIYVRDVVGATTVWASTNSRALLGQPNAISYNHVISADGRFVAYEATTNAPITGATPGIILRFNVATGLTDVINTHAFVANAAPEDVRNLGMTPDGRFIAFVGSLTSLTHSETAIYLWDAQSGTTTLVSGDLNGNVPANTICDWPALAPDGSSVAFLSSAPLVTNSVAGDYHLYVRNIAQGATLLVDSDTNGMGSSVGPGTEPRISANGRFVAFESFDANLIANDRNHDYDVILRDTFAGTNELISARHPALPSNSANGPSVLTSFAASSDGRYLAFSSDADNLVANDTNGFRDVFVRDLLLATNLLASVSTNGTAADGLSFEPAISADGRYVAFTSSADNLVASDSNAKQDVFRRDLQTGTTVLVSVNTAGTAPANNNSHAPTISGDGRWVLFCSRATDLTSGTFTGENLFVRDLQAGTTYTLTKGGVTSVATTTDAHLITFGSQGGSLYVWDTTAARNVYTNSVNGFPLAIAPTGNPIVYGLYDKSGLYALDRFANTSWQITSYDFWGSIGHFSTNGQFLAYAAALNNNPQIIQIYVYDFQKRTNLLVSQNIGPAPVNGPDLSSDGRFVAYRSFATNLVGVSNSNGLPNLFLYDQATGGTTLLTASRYGGATADNRSVSPFFSGDGRTVFFQSFASDLVTNDFNHSGDLFALTLLYASIVTGTNGQGPTLSWPARPGENYRVQFKSNLSDTNWQDVSGNVVITGNQAQFTDLAPASGQRFYRVVAF
jgi:Tol biopolymer transport system component